MLAAEDNSKEKDKQLVIEEEEKQSPQNVPVADDLSIVEANQSNADNDFKCPSPQVRDSEQADVQGAEHASLPDKTVAKGLETAALYLKANLLTQKPTKEANIHAQESVKFLKATQVWDRLMQDAITFNAETKKANPLLQRGIHNYTRKIW